MVRGRIGFRFSVMLGLAVCVHLALFRHHVAQRLELLYYLLFDYCFASHATHSFPDGPGAAIILVATLTGVALTVLANMACDGVFWGGYSTASGSHSSGPHYFIFNDETTSAGLCYYYTDWENIKDRSLVSHAEYTVGFIGALAAVMIVQWGWPYPIVIVVCLLGFETSNGSIG